MNARRYIFPLLLPALLQAAPAFAARLSSAGFIDVIGNYGYGSGYLISSTFEQKGNLQDLAVSTQSVTGILHRSGNLSYYPIPAPVFDLTPVIVSSSAVRLTWTAPSADASRAGERAEYYTLRYTTAGYIDTDEEFSAAALYPQVWGPLAPGQQESRIVEGFNAGTTYYFALQTLNSHILLSELSNPAAAVALVPLAPLNFQLVRNDNNITMIWIPPAGFENRIAFNDRQNPSYPYEVKRYEVYRAEAPAGAEWTRIGEPLLGSPTWTEALPSLDRPYYYHARAINEAGASPPSYVRSTEDAGLFFLAPDNQSTFQVSEAGSASFFSASSDPMDVYTLEISTHQEDLTERVVKSVEFAVYRGGMEPAPFFKLESNGTLKMFYAKSGSVIVPSLDNDDKRLSMYYYNGSKWLQMYGEVDESERSVSLQTSLLGRYQLRTIERSGVFSADRVGLLNRFITPNDDGKNDTMVYIFDNPQAADVKGKIYDLRGALVGAMTPGPVANSLTWDAKAGGKAVPGGVYIYQLEADGRVFNGTIVVVR